MTSLPRWLRPALLTGALLTVAAVWLSSLQPYDPDTWWHLRTGQLIVQTRTIPHADPYSYVLDGGPWITFEWLSEVIFYGVSRLSQPHGIEALKAVLAVACAWAFFGLGGWSAWTFLVLVLGFITHHEFLSGRPQLFDYVLLPLFIWLCGRERAPRKAWLLTIAASLWANLHGGAAFLGAMIVGLRAAVDWPKPSWKPWTALAAACGLAVFVNPHGWKLLTHTAGTVWFPGREQIGEWRPFGWKFVFSWEGTFMLAGAVAMAASWGRRPYLVLCAGLFWLMSLSAVRHLFLYTLTVSPVIGLALEDALPAARRWSAALAAGAAAILLAAGFTWRYSEYVPGRLPQVVKYPVQAVRYLDDNDIGGRMFHSYNLGGWLIGRCWPRRKVFVDGRNLEYGPAFIREAMHWNAPNVFQALDRRWHFDYALFENSQEYKAAYFDHAKDWALVFWDDAGLVYLKRADGHDELIRRDAYKLLKPNEPGFGYLVPLLKDPRSAREVMAEIDRSIASSPENIDARQMKAFCLDALGKPDEALAELKRAAALFPDKASPQMALGYWYERRGRLDDARASYETARWAAERERDPMSQAYVDNNLAMVLARLGDIERARSLLRECLWLFPRHPEALRNLRRLGS